MRIFEVVLSAEVAAHLQILVSMGKDVVLLGREFGGARLITAGLPAPADREGWEAMKNLPHGPVGLLGNPPDENLRARLLPGDILVEATPESDPSTWKARVLDWTGPSDETALRDVPISVA